jgi:hypothetical protein
VFLLLGDAPAPTAALGRGVERLQAGDALGAERAFGEVQGGGGMFATLARAWRIRALEALDRGDEARALDALDEWIPSLHGGAPLYLDSEYHAVMREIAEAEDVALVDGRAALQSGDYFDFCHFDAAGHARVAEVLASAIADTLGVH